MSRAPALVFALLAAAALPACGPSRTGGPGTPGAPQAPERVLPAVPAPAPEPITVRAWAEPRRQPPAGGQAQIVVLVRRKTGEPLPGVEVVFDADEGALFSRGQVRTTDAGGRTRDRLTTREKAVVTVNAGGTIERVEVDVAAAPGR
jgi:hypothetical protein